MLQHLYTHFFASFMSVQVSRMLHPHFRTQGHSDHPRTCRYMYVADLVSMPTARSKGYGYHLFSFLEETAKKAGCARYAAPRAPA